MYAWQWNIKVWWISEPQPHFSTPSRAYARGQAAAAAATPTRALSRTSIARYRTCSRRSLRVPFSFSRFFSPFPPSLSLSPPHYTTPLLSTRRTSSHRVNKTRYNNVACIYIQVARTCGREETRLISCQIQLIDVPRFFFLCTITDIYLTGARLAMRSDRATSTRLERRTTATSQYVCFRREFAAAAAVRGE